MKTRVFVPSRLSGFSLIEVVLAIGIFLVTILALVGLLGPTLQSVDEVEKTGEVASVVNTVNAFLQHSQEIAPTDSSKFDALYNAVSSDDHATLDHATLFVFRAYQDSDPDSNAISQIIRFSADEEKFINRSARVDADDAVDFGNAAGSIYRVVLSASSALPLSVRSSARNESGVYTLSQSVSDYPEGSLAIEVRIFAEDPGSTFTEDKDLASLADESPVFTYNTAIVR